MKYILFVFLSVNLFAFDGMEIEQLLFCQDKMTELNKVIEREKNPRDLKILKDIKALLAKDDMVGFEQYIKDVLRAR
jgi:hypothetical protein